jgi:hypothetical protein
MASAESSGPRTYGNWRRPTSAGLGQLGTIGTALLLVGLIFTVVLVAFFGLLVAAVFALFLAGFVGLLSIKDRHNRTGLQRIATRVGWWRTRLGGSHLYRSGPLGQTPWGTFQLPGLAAASRLSEGSDSYNRPFALLHVPATSHFTVVFSTEPDGASLVDEEQVDLWVAHWGQWLAGLGTEPGLVAASVTVETAPDSGTRLWQEVNGHIDPAAPALAKAVLESVVQDYPEGSATVKAWVALTFTGSKGAGAGRRDAEDMGRVLASRLPGLSQGLQATGAGAARPVTAQELCEVVRTAYDPRAARLLEAAYAAGERPELSWNDAGPSATQATWDSYRHEGAVSVSWSMTQAPRGEVFSSVLAKLLAPHTDVDRKRVTLLYRPIDPARAATIVENDKRNADFRATSSHTPSARAQRDQRAAAATAQEEARGAGLVNFGMVVTATVMSTDRLPDASAAIDTLSATARIQLRPVYGSQDSAFAAGLPLGLVLPRHLKIPDEIRQSL